VIFIPLTVVSLIDGRFKRTFLGWRSSYEGRLKSSWTNLITPFTFLRSWWSVVRSAPLAKGGTSKERLSPNLHKIPTRSNKVSPRTFRAALVVTPPS
jgi:hypothetical protein